MIKGNNLNLADIEKAKRVQKKAIPVQVTFASVDGVCATQEGLVAYKAGDAIMTGVEGEQWPIERGKFDATYTPVAPTKEGVDGQYVKKPFIVYALQMTEPFYVTVSWAKDKIIGKPGDWLLQYSKEDYGIVDQNIFETSYGVIQQNKAT